MVKCIYVLCVVTNSNMVKGRLKVKILDYLDKCNTKYSVNMSRMLELKQYYLSMYRFYMVKLYEKGYISDPTIFSKKEVLQNILDLHISGVFDITGSARLEEDWLSYVKYVNKNNKEVSEFIDLLYLAVKYRDYSLELDLFSEEFIKTISLKLTFVGSKIVPRNKMKLSKGSLQCIIPQGKKLSTVNIKSQLWDIAMVVLGIPKEHWYLDGLFDKRLTHEQEVECINILLDGQTSVEGKYSEKLKDWLFNHKWLKGGMYKEKQGLISYIYLNMTDEVFSALQEELGKLDPEKVKAIIEDTIYFEDEVTEYKIPISYFTVATFEEDLLLEGNEMFGYTGEAYSKEYLEEEGIPFVGLPIRVVLDDQSKVYLYDREQVETESETWFSYNEVDFEFEDLEIENTFKEGTLPHELLDIYINAQKGELGTISAEYTLKEIETAKMKVAKMLLRRK